MPAGPPIANGVATVAPAAGELEAQRAHDAASVEALNTLQTSVASSPARRAIIDNMNNEMQNFSSGPGMGHLRGAETLLNQVGAGINTQGIQSAQLFDQGSQKLAQAQGAALGPLTNDKLHAEQASVANSTLQPDTNRTALAQAAGNEDALNAVYGAFKATGKPASQFQDWQASIAPVFNPQVYQILRMNPADQAQQLATMQKAGTLDKFKQSVRAMAAVPGLIPAPQSAAPTASTNGN